MDNTNLHAHTYHYPTAKKDNIVDDYHGTKVADPYRWLEDQQAEDTKAWGAAQQNLTETFLAGCPAREQLKNNITSRWNYEQYSMPTKCNEYYFYWKNDGLQNHYVLYRAKDLTDKPLLVLNPNTFSEDGTIAVEDTALSKNGHLLAYSTATYGSDWKKINILNIETGITYPETIEQCKFTQFCWKHDNSGFYYNRFLSEKDCEDGIYWHTLGTDQSHDQLIHKNQHPTGTVTYPCITNDGRYLLLTSSEGVSKNGYSYQKIDSQNPFTTIFDGSDSLYSFVGNRESVFYFVTDNKAPRGRLIAIDIEKDVTKWQTIIPETGDTLSGADIVNNQFICHYNQNAQSSLRRYSLDGSFIGEIPLPTLGSADYCVDQTETELFISFTSFLYPPTVFRYNFKSNTLTQIWGVNINFAPSSYETKQIFYESKDKTVVPMFITYKKGIPLNQNNPTLLYGYGGFGNSVTPFFSISGTTWLEQGGILAVANIRGGDEYGKNWHQAALSEKRQNAFNDFIAAGEWLINSGYTSSRKLAILGRSNGGLLVGVCMQQRPDLFGAVISKVPVTDMLRFHQFTAGQYWVTEFGDVNKPEDFKALYAYSPLHNVQDGVTYPPLLVTSADTDTRVVPLHAKKWVARLQAASNGENQILLRYDTKAGHGAGKPTAKIIEELTDQYAFLFKVFGMEFHDSK